ncbi:MAG: hypothetical protein QE279_05295 [Rhodoferax sp.]|nr:hypothetical protein [Rhodoferax sp.]
MRDTTTAQSTALIGHRELPATFATAEKAIRALHSCLYAVPFDANYLGRRVESAVLLPVQTPCLM